MLVPGMYGTRHGSSSSSSSTMVATPALPSSCQPDERLHLPMPPLHVCSCRSQALAQEDLLRTGAILKAIAMGARYPADSLNSEDISGLSQAEIQAAREEQQVRLAWPHTWWHTGALLARAGAWFLGSTAALASMLSIRSLARSVLCPAGCGGEAAGAVRSVQEHRQAVV